MDTITLRRLSALVLGLTIAVAGPASAQKLEASDGAAAPGRWSELGGGITGYYVDEMVVFGSELVAAGWFSEAGGQTAANIAAWDGNSWRPLGSGPGAKVTAMTVYNGQLVVGGSFQVAGGYLDAVRRWDGSSWVTMGWDDNIPTAMASYDGRLFVAYPEYLPPYLIEVAHIAWWDGVSWAYNQMSFSPGPETQDQAHVYTLDVVGNKLLVGGLLADQYIVTYDAQSGWSSAGRGPYVAHQFIDYGGSVVCGGYDPLLMTWDGSVTWTPTGDVWDPGCGSIFALEVFNGLLVAGGDFTGGGCPPDPYLVTWDGSAWSTLGSSGMNASVRDLIIYGGHLIAAGNFTQAGNKPASLIAEWSQPVPAEATSWGSIKARYLNKDNPNDE